MKATLQFNLPEEKEQFSTANRGMDWALVVWDINELLRKKLKYEEHVHDTRVAIEDLRKTINDILTDRGLKYPE